MNVRSDNRRALWFVLGLTLLLLAVAVSFSFSRGRLQYEMDYEDIITHIDGLKRWRDLSEGGVWKFFTGYAANPPHCPLHSFTAAVGFMIFGVHDWAPYVLNGVFLFGFLLLAQRLTKGLGLVASCVAVLGAALVPLSFQTIHQFRPDFPCALATLWGMLVYPMRLGRDFEKRAGIAGLFFGLALLAKPPFFPFTLAMGALPWLISVAASYRAASGWTGAWCAIRRSWPFFAATAIVAGPHYFVAWKKILEYIQLNQFGENAHVWKMTGGLDFQIVYHVFGYSGIFMLGNAVWILIALVLAGFALSFVLRRRASDNCLRFIYLFAVTLWAWIFIAWNPHMNPFFGLTFQYALVLCGMFVLAWVTNLILLSGRRGMLVFPAALVAALACMAVPFREHDQKFTNADPELHNFARDLPREVYRRLMKWRWHSDAGYTLLSTYGIVSSHRLQWMADKNRQKFQFFGVPFWPIDRVVELFDQETKIHDRIDFAVVSEPGAEGVFEELPNADTTGGLIEWLNGKKEYRAVETILTPSGKKYFLYMAAPNFGVFENVSGLGPKTGPVNLAGKPMVKHVLASDVALE
ncbi:MAG: glycosyltransferase family 39 protein, partial [Verrucomicrobiota bacterium]